MSDPMTNIEIEDVLSSIRRLVAQDQAPQRAPMPGRLVLTPAQRVDDVGAARAGQAEGGLAMIGASDDGERPGTSAAGDPDAGAAPEGPQSMAEGSVGAGNIAQPQPGPQAAVLPDTPGRDADDGAGARMQSLEETVAELEAAMLRHESDWEVDEPGSGAAEWQGEAVLAGLAFLRSSSSAAAPETTGPEGPTVPEAAVPAHVLGDDLEDVEEHAAGWQPSQAPDPEEILDEEMLRHLIAEVLREELRGELGRKITSSLRGMIRREVQMALSGLLRN